MFPTLLRDTFRAAPVEAMVVSPAALASAEVSGIEALVRRRLDDAPSNVERFQALEQLRRERWLSTVFASLAAHDIPAVTFKGWSLARLLRPPRVAAVGDVDLLVRPEDLDHAAGCSPRSRVAPRWTSRRISPGTFPIGARNSSSPRRARSRGPGGRSGCSPRRTT
jgi:hypothetical protein